MIDFSIIRIRKYQGGFSVSLFSWIGKSGFSKAVIHFGIGLPSPENRFGDDEKFPTD